MHLQQTVGVKQPTHLTAFDEFFQSPQLDPDQWHWKTPFFALFETLTS
jgi:hypothetical protein